VTRGIVVFTTEQTALPPLASMLTAAVSHSSAVGQTWQARAAERFDPAGRHKNWSQGAAGAGAAALKVVELHV